MGAGCWWRGCSSLVLSFVVALAMVSPAGAAVWVQQHAPAPAGTAQNALTSVSCLTMSLCEATGSSSLAAGGRTPLAEGWDGTRWRLQYVPTGILSQVGLPGVSCAAANFCVAVGSVAATPSIALAYRWDGLKWRRMSLPAANSARLQSVSCPAIDTCTAVGWTEASGSQRTLAEHWDGSAWSVQPTPSIPDQVHGGDYISEFAGVSCTSASDCTAVGAFQPLQEAPLAESWDGSAWTVTLADPANLGSALKGVSCSGADTCTAVGSGDTSSGTIAMRWNGSSWSAQTVPQSDTDPNTGLAGVACPSATWCATVGITIGPGGSGEFASKWNGVSWSQQPTPAISDALDGISCPAPGKCIAVGDAGRFFFGHWPLVETFNSAVPSQFILSVHGGDDGSWGTGNVTSNPAGIDCGSSGGSCRRAFPRGTKVTLTETPDAGSTFSGWSVYAGDVLIQPSCYTDPTCTFTVPFDHEVTVTKAGAQFFTSTRPPKNTLLVVPSSTGAANGTVTSEPAGIDCGSAAGACSAQFNAPLLIKLTATPDPGSVLVGWGGLCTGRSLTCWVPFDTTTAVTIRWGPAPARQ